MTIYRIATFNMKRSSLEGKHNSWNERKASIHAILKKIEPDIIGTQELTIDSLNSIKNFLNLYNTVGCGRRGGDKGEFAAIFYRKDKFECIKSDTFWLSPKPQTPGSRGWLSFFPRICTWCILKDKRNDIYLRIYNTHLDHISPLARKQGLELIKHYANKHNSDLLTGTILMGDFNASPKSASYKEMINTDDGINIFYNNTFNVLYKTGEKTLRTYHGFKGKVYGRPIDYIFTTKNLSIERAKIDQNIYAAIYPSDHYPVIADIELP